MTETPPADLPDDLPDDLIDDFTDDAPEAGDAAAEAGSVLGLPEPEATYSLQQFPEKLAVVKLPKGAEIPSWAESSSLFSVTATATETSVVCAGRDVPTKVVAAKGLTGFAVQQGPGHETVGLLVALLGPLADAGLSVFTISTFETVWILVPSLEAEQAAEAWRAHGHEVALAVPVKPTKKKRK